MSKQKPRKEEIPVQSFFAVMLLIDDRDNILLEKYTTAIPRAGERIMLTLGKSEPKFFTVLEVAWFIDGESVVAAVHVFESSQ